MRIGRCGRLERVASESNLLKMRPKHRIVERRCSPIVKRSTHGRHAPPTIPPAHISAIAASKRMSQLASNYHRIVFLPDWSVRSDKRAAPFLTLIDLDRLAHVSSRSNAFSLRAALCSGSSFIFSTSAGHGSTHSQRAIDFLLMVAILLCGRRNNGTLCFR